MGLVTSVVMEPKKRQRAIYNGGTGLTSDESSDDAFTSGESAGSRAPHGSSSEEYRSSLLICKESGVSVNRMDVRLPTDRRHSRHRW